MCVRMEMHTHVSTARHGCAHAHMLTCKYTPIKEVCFSPDKCSQRHNLEAELAEIDSEKQTVHVLLALWV